MDDLTPIHDFDNWTAKRDDLACFSGPDFPSGSKVRQYAKMAAASPDAPMIVGCSAGSAMQIYVAAAAKQNQVKGIVYTAARLKPTDATKYARRMGAEIIEVRPGYLSVCRSRARKRAKEFPACVRWDVPGALKDAADQCANIPLRTQRIVVPTGSGLTCSGVLAGMAEREWTKQVFAVCVSNLATTEKIIATAAKLTDKPLPSLKIVRTPTQYDEWEVATLPNGFPLDPFYAAKAMPFVRSGDCFWIPGLRPVGSMPKECRKKFQNSPCYC